MLENLCFLDWARLGLSLVIFIGIGKGTISWLDGLGSNSSPIFVKFTLAFAVAVSLWAILLPWLNLLGLDLLIAPIVLTISLWGWVVWLIRAQPIRKSKLSLEKHLIEFPVWLIVIIATAIIAFKLRYQVAAPGSDSYHHTLITALFIMDKGLPNNYYPAVPNLVTFNYHFGFHAISAILSLLSGWQPRLLILAMAPILVGLSGLSVAYFVFQERGVYRGAAFSAMVPTLLSVFPIGMLEWGRFPQTLGLILLPVFLSEYQRLWDHETRKSQTLLIGILGAGLLLTHYRVAIMGILAVLTRVIIEAFAIKANKSGNVFLAKITIHLTVAFWALVLTSPWFIRIIRSQSIGYADPLLPPASSFYSITRLGSKVLEYPTNLFLIVCTVLVIFSLCKNARSQTARWIFIWMIVLLGASYGLQGFGITSIDPITVLVSLYVPISILLGWGFSSSSLGIQFSTKAREIVSIIFFLILGVWGISNLVVFLRLPIDAYVYKEDLKAAEWIKHHVPGNALFMVNTYRFDFSENFIIGIDAGAWLPLLAERRVVTYPMTTAVERFRMPHALADLVELHNLANDLASEKGASILREHGVTHVYVGKKGGPINPQSLLTSKFYTLIYSEDGVYIFALNSQSLR
jgi:hypothetical protein